MSCKIVGCKNTRFLSGMCQTHYKTLPFVDRILTQIEKKDSGCWEFVGNTNKAGYGRVSYDGVVWLAHRAAYHCLVKPISDTVKVLHKCDNPPCVNPDHLFIGSQTDNVLDMWNKGRGVYPPLHFGCKQHSAKLNDEIAATIYARLNSGERGNALAKEYGVSVTAISRIKTGKGWKHIHGHT